MADDSRRKNTNHSVFMEQRNKLTITGVTDVLSFDEEGVIADTEMGILIIKGRGMHVGKLNVDDGSLSVDGEVESIEYTEAGMASKNKNSFFGKIFR